LNEGILIISGKSVKRLKEKVRKITRRNRGRSLTEVIEELSPVLRGWLMPNVKGYYATLILGYVVKYVVTVSNNARKLSQFNAF